MGLPKRWLPYSKFGQQIPGTRFIALKCPLRNALVQNLSHNDHFTPGLLKELLPEVKMVIDLTYTTKYYNPMEFEAVGLRHVKVKCAGQNVPNNEVVNNFIAEVDSFLEKDRDGLIGVHCTHGVNRTGFLICKYMILKLGFQPQDAVKAFGEARGHHMERINYVINLGVQHKIAKEMIAEQPTNINHEYKSDDSHHGQVQRRSRERRGPVPSGRGERPPGPPLSWRQAPPPRYNDRYSWRPNEYTNWREPRQHYTSPPHQSSWGYHEPRQRQGPRAPPRYDRGLYNRAGTSHNAHYHWRPPDDHCPSFVPSQTDGASHGTMESHANNGSRGIHNGTEPDWTSDY